MLQGVSLDLSEAVKQLNKTDTFFRRWHSDEGFLEALTDAKELAKEIDLEDTTFPATKEVRVRNKKRLFDYESPDEPVVNPQDNFETSFFFAVLDTVIQSSLLQSDLISWMITTLISDFFITPTYFQKNRKRIY